MGDVSLFLSISLLLSYIPKLSTCSSRPKPKLGKRSHPLSLWQIHTSPPLLKQVSLIIHTQIEHEELALLLENQGGRAVHRSGLQPRVYPTPRWDTPRKRSVESQNARNRAEDAKAPHETPNITSQTQFVPRPNYLKTERPQRPQSPSELCPADGDKGLCWRESGPEVCGELRVSRNREMKEYHGRALILRGGGGGGEDGERGGGKEQEKGVSNLRNQRNVRERVPPKPPSQNLSLKTTRGDITTSIYNNFHFSVAHRHDQRYPSFFHPNPYCL